MLYSHDISHSFEDRIGSGGISDAEERELRRRLVDIRNDIDNHELEAVTALLKVPGSKKDLIPINEVAHQIKENFSDVVVVGMGGSSLNAQSLTAIAARKRNGPKLHFFDNISPHTIENELNDLPLSDTAFLIVSKSGNTIETLALTFICLSKLKEAVGEEGVGKHFFFVTENKENMLRSLGESVQATMIDHNPHIGGRFSALTNVGLLPAAIAGLDIAEFLLGADKVVKNFHLNDDAYVIDGALFSYTFMKKERGQSVMMAYADRLNFFTKWHRQIWAESLGKDGVGSTPINAIGAVDQHSQLQLWLDGPQDKTFTFILLDREGKGPKIDVPKLNGHDLSMIQNKHLGDIMAAEQRATVDVLVQNNSPVRTINLPTLNEGTLGALLMHFMLETILVAELMNVNAFNQPAVEDGKQIARDILLGDSSR